MPELCVIDVPQNGSLEDLLFNYGIEFPCGGASLCGGCRVRVVEGDVPISDEMRDALSDYELSAGWRLACKARARGRIVLEIAQWGSPVLTDDAQVRSEMAEGWAVAVDLGTTTLVAQLIDLKSGEIHSVRTALNPQASHGADVMSRVEFDLRNPGLLTNVIRHAIGVLVEDVAQGRQIREVLIAGNTVMHHLFCGISVEPLSHVPFESHDQEQHTFSAAELGWTVGGWVTFLPCLGGFVGSDILAGIVAVGLLDSDVPVALVDLGTNGEIVVGRRSGAVCASTAAGPAFEAGRISAGMRAAPGAIDRVWARDGGGFRCHVLGGADARGLCGSGLVDAVAAGLRAGLIQASGRLADGSKSMPLCGRVRVTQSDIRELQLAKGAIAAGFEVLSRAIHCTTTDIQHIHLAGAFGNYVSTASALRIGLLSADPRSITPAGNTALRGLKMLLALGESRDAVISPVRAETRHISLGADPVFQECFASHMRLAAGAMRE